MSSAFTRSPFKAVVVWVVTVFLLIMAAGCTPETPEAEEGGGLGGSGEEIEQEGEVEGGEVEEGEEEGGEED